MVKDLFLYNKAENTVEVNEPYVMLIKEFKALFDPKRNKCKEDKTGKKGLRAFKELTYIYLMINYKSPYADDPEQDRHIACLEDAGLTLEDFEDPIFREACRKYQALQDSNQSLNLIRSFKGLVNKLIVYYDTIDLAERNTTTQQPIFKSKDVIEEMQKAKKALDALKELEDAYKREIEYTDNKIRGDATPGIMDDV